jgi:predicted DNA binding protein
MPLIDTRVRIRHSCAYCELSGAFPDVQFVLWCNGDTDALRVVAPDWETMEEAKHHAIEFLGMDFLSSDDRPSLIMTGACACPTEGRSAVDLAEKHGCWSVQPIPMIGGWEYHRIFAQDQESVKEFIEDVRLFGEAELISLRSRESLDVVDQVGSMSVHMFAGLTDRQMEVLIAAFEEGLMDVPSRGSMDAAAHRIGIARSTFGEHLRKATYQLVSNAYPFIRPGSEG